MMSGGGEIVRQIMYSDTDGGVMYDRTSQNGGSSWSNWVQIITWDQLPGDIVFTDQPQTFTAAQTFSIAPTITDASRDKGDNQAATMADLKSVEKSAWRQLDFGSNANLGGALSSSYIVYQIHADEKYLSFFYWGIPKDDNIYSDNTTLMDLSPIVKGISSINFSALSTEIDDTFGNGVDLKISGTKIITSSSNHKIRAINTISLMPHGSDERRIYYTELV